MDNCDKPLIIKENTIFEQNVYIAKNTLIGESLTVGDDLNTNNLNSFGQLSVYDNIYSTGNIFLKDNKICNEDNKDSKFLYLKNDGTIVCQKIEMKNDILIGKNIINSDDELSSDDDEDNDCEEKKKKKNSIILNASNHLIKIPEHNGLFISPIAENNDGNTGNI